MIMPSWLWAVNGVLWFFALGLTATGIYKLLFKSRKLSDKAELNAFVGWNEISKIYALDKKREFGPDEPIQIFLDQQIKQIDQELKKLYKAGGEPGARGDIDMIRATKENIKAAAFFALSSILVGASAVLIAVFE
jgi:hypothetical protein